ncbi:dolichol kinase [Coemansia sp. RSA 2559]|nr:dolichol kinase [Coemansia sp. RSA 2559]KAJ2869097.1 dolichol kinase [Coemansia erecta]
MIINIKSRGDDSKHKRGRGWRLYYETCIPATLFIVTALYHGIASGSQGGESPFGFGWANMLFLPCVIYVGMALVPLFLRLEWRNTSGASWMLVARDSGVADAVPWQTSAATYRRGADDGLVWGVVLVPLVAMAAELAARIPGEAAAVSAPSVLSRADIRMASIAMGLRLALAAADARMAAGGAAAAIKGLRPPILAVWLAATGVLGCAGQGGGRAVGASAWRSWAMLLGAAEAQRALLACAVSALPRSFTLGEAAVLTQGVGLAAVDLAGSLAQRVLAADLAEHRTQWAPHIETLYLEATVVGLALLAWVLAYVARPGVCESLGPIDAGKPQKTARACAAVCLCAMLSLATVAYVACTNPVRWALAAAGRSAASIAVCIYWAALLGGGLALCAAASSGSQPAALPQTKLALHLKRKAYHALAVLLFVPGFLLSRQLQHFAFTGALAAFVVAEAARALDIPPWGRAIAGFVSRFTDSRDTGAIVTSHFYLLLGCAVPVWLGGPSAVACLSGVLALGLADSAASLVGMYAGHVRWPATAKTVEGTAGFIVCLAAAALAVDDAPSSKAAVASHIALCAVLGLVEALTEQNDNIVIPLCMYAAVHVCARMRLVAFAAACLSAASALAVMPRLASSAGAFLERMRRHR